MSAQTDIGAVVGDERTDAVWRLSVWVLGLLPAVVATTWPRSFNLAAYISEVNYILVTGQTLAGAIGAVSILVVLICSGALLIRRRTVRSIVSSFALAPLLLGIGPLCATKWATVPRISGGFLALPVVLGAAMASRAPSAQMLAREFQRVLLVYVYGSWLAVLIAPGWALERPYEQSYIAVLPVRLHGLSVHANHLAIIVSAFLVLACFAPLTRSRWHVVIATLTLLFTQSKTCLVLSLCALLIGAALRVKRQVRVVLAVLALAILITVLAAASSGDVAAWIDDSPGEGATLHTLTGRTYIWQVSLEKFWENPLFGYGPDLWDFDMSLEYLPRLGWAPAQAHNQFVQSFAQFGLIGGLAFLCYCVALLAAAARCDAQWQSVVVPLVLLLILRSLSESWIRQSLSDGNMFAHFITVSMIGANLSRRRPDEDVFELRRVALHTGREW